MGAVTAQQHYRDPKPWPRHGVHEPAWDDLTSCQPDHPGERLIRKPVDRDRLRNVRQHQSLPHQSQPRIPRHQQPEHRRDNCRGRRRHVDCGQPVWAGFPSQSDAFANRPRVGSLSRRPSKDCQVHITRPVHRADPRRLLHVFPERVLRSVLSAIARSESPHEVQRRVGDFHEVAGRVS